MHLLAPETEYICDLARAWARGIDATVPQFGALDPDRLVRLLSSQPAMQTLVGHLDPAVLTEQDQVLLDRAVEISRRRTTMMLLELERVLPALARQGCRPVVLKGASLALTVYDAPEDRWFIDIDLLVEPDQLDSAYAALERLGYRFLEDSAARTYYEKYHFHRVMISTQGVCIEVHWAITMPHSVYRYEIERLHRDAFAVPLGAGTVFAPHAVDQVLHGVLQSIPAGFGDLRRILDLHRLDAVLSADERRNLCVRARRYNLATGLWLQYRLRETIIGETVPAIVDEQCRPSAHLVRILDRLDLTTGCLEKHATRTQEYQRLIHWLCVPAGSRAREVGRYVLPNEENRLQTEMRTGKRVTLLDMPVMILQRLLNTGRLLGHLVRAI